MSENFSRPISARIQTDFTQEVQDQAVSAAEPFQAKSTGGIAALPDPMEVGPQKTDTLNEAFTAGLDQFSSVLQARTEEFADH